LAIDKRPLDAQAADALREEIVRGRIAAGSRLTEQELAGAMGLSRGTVRAALAQLVRDGLVTLVPYTGWAVRELDADDVWELYTLRASLEGLGARLAATRADAGSVAVIERTFAGLVDACAGRDAAAMADRDFALHAGIIAAAAHSRLAEQYRTVEHQVRMFIISSDALIADPHELVEQHRPLVEAIAAGDPLRAEAEAVLHNTREGEKLVAHLQRAAAAGLVDA
jgi:DNA-binding GntR family transcriptional regulator